MTIKREKLILLQQIQNILHRHTSKNITNNKIFNTVITLIITFYDRKYQFIELKNP